MTVDGQRAWWPRPVLGRDGGGGTGAERRVTWLELFFDLVFVVVLSRLAHGLAHHVSGSGLAAFAVQFAAVFWAWNAFTYYIERFESAGLDSRVFAFTAMLAVAALAVWTEDGLGRHYAGFAVAYLATRAVNIAQWTRAAVHVPEFRAISARFVAGFAVTAAVIAAAGRLDGAARVAVFAVAVLTDIATPLTTLRRQAALPPLSASKFPERFGLLTMIVLGESVVGVIAGLSDLNEAGDLGGGQIASGGLALLVGIGLWWLYFDFVARRPPQPRFGTALAWVYLHLVTLAAVTAIGATISVAIGESVDAALSPPVRLLLGGSVAVALLGLAALELTLHRGDDEPTHPTLSPALKAGAGIVIGAAAALDLGWTATALLAAIDVSLAVPAAYGVAVWYSPANTRARDRLAHGEAVS